MQRAGSSSEKRPPCDPRGRLFRRSVRRVTRVPHGRTRDAGLTASYMETLLMTENGIEVLSIRPRTLTVIGG
jgi:hypothetical protein